MRHIFTPAGQESCATQPARILFPADLSSGMVWTTGRIARLVTTTLRLRHFFAHELWTMDLETVPCASRLALRLLRLILAVAFEVRVRLRNARTADPEGVGLVPSPELMAIHDVLNIVHSGPAAMRGFSQKTNVQIEDLLRQRDAAIAQRLEGMTLRSLIASHQKVLPEPDSDGRG